MSHPASASEREAAWWAIQSKPREEARAEASLHACGVETFLPLARRVSPSRSKNSYTVKVEPLFPRYLFARCESPGMAHRIRFARGVTRILGADERPATVDETIIAAIRERVAPDGYVRLTPALKPGDQVRVVAGPLKDFVGVLESFTDGSDRVRLLLAALHGQWRAEVDGNLVTKM